MFALTDSKKEVRVAPLMLNFEFHVLPKSNVSLQYRNGLSNNKKDSERLCTEVPIAPMGGVSMTLRPPD